MEKYIGDIYLITKINKKLLKYLSTNDIIDDDYLVACEYVLAKENASLIKKENYYIDVENLDEKDLNNLHDNKLLKNEIYDPFIGQLFVKNIRKIKELKNTFK